MIQYLSKLKDIKITSLRDIEQDLTSYSFDSTNDLNHLKFQTLSTSGWDAKEAPASWPNPVTIFKTPGGRPISLYISPNSRHVLKL